MQTTTHDICAHLANQGYMARCEMQMKKKKTADNNCTVLEISNIIQEEILSFMKNEIVNGNIIYISSIGQFFLDKTNNIKKTKPDLTNYISSKFKIDLKIAKNYVDNFFDCIIYYLISQEEVYIKGFGKFTLTDKSRRVVKTFSGEENIIEQHKSVKFTSCGRIKEDPCELIFKFKCSSTLKDICKGYKTITLPTNNE